MIYRFFRVLVSFVCKIYFRKIYLSGMENLPEEGPLFITANHPDGFTEPLLLACFLPRELHFLVRGDVFENPVLKPLLVATNEIPIYRTKDGFSNLRNNNKTFEMVAKVLDKGDAILVFAEGSTELVKRVRHIQKGTAKMAQKSIHMNGDLDLKIVPICLYYTEQNTFRSEVIIVIGSPIVAKKYVGTENSENSQGIIDLTREIESKMKDLIPNIDDAEIPDIENFSARAYEHSSYNAFRTVERSDQRIIAEQKLIENVRKGYAGELKKRKLFYPDLWSFLLFLPALLGWIFHIVPGFITKWMADWLVNAKVFTNAIRMVVGMVVFIIYYVVIIILLGNCVFPFKFIWIPGLLFGIVYFWYDSHNYKSYLTHNNIFQSK